MRSMRICLDGQGHTGRLTGGGKALVFLLRQLRHDFPQHEYTVLSAPGRGQWRLPRQLFWEQVQFPWWAFRLQANLLHAPAGMSGPLLRHRRLVMTVHDIAPTRHPEFLPNVRSRWYWGRWIPLTARFADCVLVPSASTKRDLVELVRIPEARIRVIPLGVPLDPLGAADPGAVEKVRDKYRLPARYILYVGTIDRRKDYPTLLRAIHELDVGRHLVVAGSVIAGRTNFPQMVEQLGLKDRVRILGYVPDEDLSGLFRGAAAFVYPSFYEGFGLPVLEAMALGTPVITYHTTSLPEVVGEAGILLRPPVSPKALAAEITRVIEDETLRCELVGRGFEQAKRFDWRTTARLTLGVYEALAS